MELYTIQGKLLFATRAPSIKRTLEEAVRRKLNLDDVNLRRAKLKGAKLDGLRAQGACLWGADLSDCDLAEADLSYADCRMASLLDTCLAGAYCTAADFSGAYFSRTLMEGAYFSQCRFSCPSILSQSLHLCASLEQAVYWHRGERPCALDKGLVRLGTGGHELMILDDKLFHNGAFCYAETN